MKDTISHGHPAKDLRALKHLNKFSFDKAIPSTINFKKEKLREEAKKKEEKEEKERLEMLERNATSVDINVDNFPDLFLGDASRER